MILTALISVALYVSLLIGVKRVVESVDYSLYQERDHRDNG